MKANKENKWGKKLWKNICIFDMRFNAIRMRRLSSDGFFDGWFKC
jgi:hypothetical protein